MSDHDDDGRGRGGGPPPRASDARAKRPDGGGDDRDDGPSSLPNGQHAHLRHGATLVPQRPAHPARSVPWDDLGRDAPAAGGRDALAARIERNAILLEDLLATALRYDAGRAAATRGDRSPDAPARLVTPALRSAVRSYVGHIAATYHPVGFHSFAHASHVTLSAAKMCCLLQERSPWQPPDAAAADDDDLATSPPSPVPDLDDTIYDPWLHAALVFAALLHDAGHTGLPNAALAAEGHPLAARYGDPARHIASYAEWHAVVVGLAPLQENGGSGGKAGAGPHAALAAALGGGRVGTARGAGRFYDMLTDLVLCTDIASKERRERGLGRYRAAVCEGEDGGEAGAGAPSQVSRAGEDRRGRKRSRFRRRDAWPRPRPR